MIEKIKTLWLEFKKNWIVDYSPDEKTRMEEERKQRLEELAEYHKEIKRITDDIKNAKYLHELQLIALDIADFYWRFYSYSFEGFDDMTELLEKDRSKRIDEIQNLSAAL